MKQFIITTTIFLLSLISGNVIFAQEETSLYIEVEGLRNTKGLIRIAIFDRADGFPETTEKALRTGSFLPTGSTTVLQFSGLKPGELAYSILHDEDEDGEMKKNLVGIPREGFGFSQNYRPRIKNPSFEDASITLNSGKNTHTIKMIYF